MPRKKLAVLTARADDRIQKDILCGIAYAAFAADADVIVFTNIHNHFSEDRLLTFENAIYDLNGFERRLQGCKNAFEKHCIPFDKSKIFYGDFWYGSGKALAKRYLSSEL